jgi:hypothetical protein
MRTGRKSLAHKRYTWPILGMWLLSAVAWGDAGNPLTGFYYGTATIFQSSGTGIVDLAFYLDVTGSSFREATSYIDLDKTLIFPSVSPQINGKTVGPRVSGVASSTKFTLVSQSFTGQALAKTVTRKIRLDSVKVSNGGTVISGNYVDTADGFTDGPLTIKGTFQLRKPVAAVAVSGRDSNGDGCLDLGEIRAGGADADIVEFSDVSAAMDLYRHPKAELKVGDPPGPACSNGAQVVQDAVKAYYGNAR